MTQVASTSDDSKNFFIQIKKQFEEALQQIVVPSDQEEEIILSTGLEIIRDEVLGVFPLGKAVKAILTCNEKIDEDLREKKKELLLALYIRKTSDDNKRLDSLVNFISSPQGHILFNKILRILDEEPIDLELIKYLASILKTIVNSDFEKLFEEYKFVLAQIESMTIQAMSILADVKNWPRFDVQGIIQTSGEIVTSDWTPWFVENYCKVKGISDSKIQARIRHAVQYLFGNHFICCKKIGEKEYQCLLYPIGREIFDYLSN